LVGQQANVKSHSAEILFDAFAAVVGEQNLFVGAAGQRFDIDVIGVGV
jgi:hypothetical protein